MVRRHRKRANTGAASTHSACVSLEGKRGGVVDGRGMVAVLLEVALSAVANADHSSCRSLLDGGDDGSRRERVAGSGGARVVVVPRALAIVVDAADVIVEGGLASELGLDLGGREVS
ncbi:hypothetical protein PMAYCL1PPCAC_14058, partial [Pristionchus mayeri]